MLFLLECAWFAIFSIQSQIRRKAKLESTMGYAQVNAIMTIVLLVGFGFSYPVSLLDHGLSDFLRLVQLNEARTTLIVLFNLGFDLLLNGNDISILLAILQLRGILKAPEQHVPI